MIISNLGIFAQLDPDALAFVDAAGITDGVQITAINILVKRLKIDGVWGKMFAIYPFIGGTATTHKYNLKDPQDTDGSFRITWVNSSTHSSTGVAGNGTTSYGNTHFQPFSHFDTSDWTSMGFYSRTEAADTDEYVLGCNELGFRAYTMIVRRTTDTGFWFTDGPTPTFRRTSGTVTDGRGFFQGSQNGTNLDFYRNTTSIGGSELSGVDSSFSTLDAVILASHNNGTIERYTQRQCAFAYIGTKLTSSEHTGYYNTVQGYQTTLSRNV